MWLESKQLGINPLKLEARIIILKCLCKRKQLILEVLSYMKYETNSDNPIYILPTLKATLVFVTIVFSVKLAISNLKYIKISPVRLKELLQWLLPVMLQEERRQFSEEGEVLSHPWHQPDKAPLFPCRPRSFVLSSSLNSTAHSVTTGEPTKPTKG